MQPLPGSAEFPNDNPLLHQGAVWICTRVRGSPRAILRASRPPPEPGPEAVPVPVPVPVFVCAPVPLADPTPEPVPEPEPVSVSVPVPVPVFVCVPMPLADPEPLAVAEPEPLAVAEPEASVPELEPERVCGPVAEPDPVLAAIPEAELPPSVAELAATSEPAPVPVDDPFADYLRAVGEVVLDAGLTRAAAAIPACFEGASFAAEAFDKTTRDLLVARGFAQDDGMGGLVPSAGFRTTVGVWRRVLRGEPADLAECGSVMLDEWTAEFVAVLLGASSARSDDVRRQLRRKGVAAFGMLARAA
jgi:hypothetical protein